LHRATRMPAARIRNWVIAAFAAVVSVVTVVAVPTPAGAAASATFVQVHRAFQYRSGRILLTGFVYDRQHQGRHPAACVVILSRCVRVIHPSLHSTHFDRLHHIRGAHRFAFTLRPRRPGIAITVRAGHGTVDRTHALSPGTRVVRVARNHVGDRYTYGATGPHSFDCSGYTMYSYRNGETAGLPHNAEAQRRTRYMHGVRRRDARPGDLVFYMSGGSAYHVAIYAGHGYQYSATDPQQGVRYQRISSRNVTFGSDWHR
jgi:hypothetical protein